MRHSGPGLARLMTTGQAESRDRILGGCRNSFDRPALSHGLKICVAVIRFVREVQGQVMDKRGATVSDASKTRDGLPVFLVAMIHYQ